MVIDGVYVARDGGSELRFVPLDPPIQEDLDRVLERVVGRVQGFLARQGYAGFGEGGGEEEEDPDQLAWMQAASIREWTALSDSPHKVDVIGRLSPGTMPVWVEKPFPVSPRNGRSLRNNTRRETTFIHTWLFTITNLLALPRTETSES